MPVLQAGGRYQVFSAPVPAAQELAEGEVIWLSSDNSPESIARQLVNWAEGDRIQRLRRRVRQMYTWQAIFQRDIQPLLKESCEA
jgi:glycosyltransferase involved in cell wall biosynthesis